MESAEKTATLERRTSWATEHWRIFFSEMPLLIPSLGSLQSPYAMITRAAPNSAAFSAVDVAVTEHGFVNESSKELTPGA
jgi:hypothetical protein